MMSLGVDDFHWHFERRNQDDKEFKLSATILLSVPYTYFSLAYR